MWNMLRLIETYVGWDSLRLFQRDVGQFAVISERCGNACAYLKQMWGQCAPISDRFGDSLRLFQADVEQIPPI